MPNYNKIYSKVDITNGDKPSQILSLVWKNFLPGSKVLDLGCGQGGDSLFLIRNGFSVIAIDNSSVAIDQLKVKKDKLGFNNLDLVCGDVKDFYIEKDKYQIIICRNVLNFLDKEDALKILNSFRDNIKSNSYLIIEVFTEDDPSFSSPDKFKSYFKNQELLNYFSGYKILYYLENVILDPGHPGFLNPHKHGVARIIAQK